MPQSRRPGPPHGAEPLSGVAPLRASLWAAAPRVAAAPPRRACADFNSGRLYSRGGSGGDRFRRPESHDARVCAAVRLHARRVASGSTVAITCKTPAPADRAFPGVYIHGYGERESERLLAQAASVVRLLHGDTRFPPGSRVLEVGCGTGAQTVSLARNNPGTQIVAFDHSTASLARAIDRVAAAGLSNVAFLHADLFALPFEAESFDHAFICFVLEHLSHPIAALRLVKQLLKPGGSVTVFEGDHGSAYFHPHSEIAHRAIACQVELQRRAGGNACIGRQLYPLLVQAGFHAPCVTPRVVYVDATTPDLVDSFTRKTFTWMVEAVREEALAARITDAATFDAGIRDLYRAAQADGVFCYTFFKGVAAKPAHLPQEGSNGRDV